MFPLFSRACKLVTAFAFIAAMALSFSHYLEHYGDLDHKDGCEICAVCVSAAVSAAFVCAALLVRRISLPLEKPARIFLPAVYSFLSRAPPVSLIPAK
ncbi:hypothetical protein Dip518_000562 [Parelusimicrobium proximum]